MTAPNESVDPSVVHVSELVDLDALGPGHRPPTPAELRAALPRGWVLEPDNEHARRDLRLFFIRRLLVFIRLHSMPGSPFKNWPLLAKLAIVHCWAEPPAHLTGRT
ncbi:MAG: hypothetical protein MK291_11070, partial [Planctomycetes bacterium]|nr:hypothetical protein [Planctomycetota bacterium]